MLMGPLTLDIFPCRVMSRIEDTSEEHNSRMETFQTQLKVFPAFYKFTNRHFDFKQSFILLDISSSEFRTIEAISKC